MHDIKTIRANAQAFDAAMAKRGVAPQSAEILKLDEEKRRLQTEIQKYQSIRNKIAKEIGIAKAKGDQERVQALLSETQSMTGNEDACGNELSLAEKQLNVFLETLPNLPAED